MMEFTYDGIVRSGFGFYNPNHAAALICALMPFLWGWKYWPWIGWCLSLFLAVPLALTYSRTGVLVLAFELTSYFILTQCRKWKSILCIVCGFVIVFVCGGVFARFALDSAITNRPEIWKAGAALFAANPWHGVGLGNSGLLASTFLLDGIACRTLVNSHLTLLVEFGIFAGFIWFALVFYALIRGIERPSAWCAFTGLILSASAASVFDWDVLFDFTTFGKLPLLNFLLSWLTLLLCLILILWLSLGKLKWKRSISAICFALFLCSVPFCFYSKNAPTVKGDFVVKQGRNMPLVLVYYDNQWTMRTVLPFLHDGYYLPLRS